MDGYQVPEKHDTHWKSVRLTNSHTSNSSTPNYQNEREIYLSSQTASIQNLKYLYHITLPQALLALIRTNHTRRDTRPRPQPYIERKAVSRYCSQDLRDSVVSKRVSNRTTRPTHLSFPTYAQTFPNTSNCREDDSGIGIPSYKHRRLIA